MEKDKDVADRDQRHREFMEKLFPAESLHQRLHPRRSIPRVRERFGDQLHRRRDLLRPLVKIHVRGQPFVVNKSHDGYATIERWITVAGLLTHPWASLDGLARSNEHTFMMLKDWNSSVGDSDGVRDRPIITIKQIQVAPPLQRQGLATEILKTMLREFYPEHLVSGEAPSPDAQAWHTHLNRVMPSRMLHFPQYSYGDDMPRRICWRVSPGEDLDPHELQ